jgi:hypothetical protein
MDRYDFLYREFVEGAGIREDHFLRLVQSDPTTIEGEKPKAGRYSQWLLVHMGRESKRLRLRLNLLFEALFKYDRLKPLLPSEFRDINRLTEESLLNVVRVHWQEKYLYSKTQWKQRVRRNQVRYLYEDERWDVVVPLTQEASYALAGPPLTRWCTAVKQDSYYENYKVEGNLYMIRDKTQVVTTGKAAGEPRPLYQVHLRRGEFFDHENEDFDFGKFLGENEELKKFFLPIFLHHFKRIKLTDTAFINIIMNVYKDERIKKILMEKCKDFIRNEKRRLYISDWGGFYFMVQAFGHQRFLDIILRCAQPTLVELKIDFHNYHDEGLEISPQITRLKKLEKLSLNGFVKNISKRISQLENLYVLSLCRNKVKSIPESIRKSKTLEVVHLINTPVDIKKEKFSNHIFLIQ